MRDIPIEFSFEGTTHRTFMQIYFPKSFKRETTRRTLIALHNTGSDLREWERNSRITYSADEYGFAIVCPNMGVTLYETKFYPETTRKWNAMPGGKWIGEVLIPFLRLRFGLASDRKYTAIAGISAAARGAVLIAETYPHLFGAVGALSGYYDPTSLSKGSAHAKVYGDYDKFQDRWNADDNVLEGAKALQHIPVFIAHGKDDTHYHFEQSRLFAVKLLMLRNSYLETFAKTTTDEELQKKMTQSIYIFELHLVRREYHNWSFWNYMIPQMMRFFHKHLEKNP
ncbi:MAG: esterase family protein [Spirochaetes bacterium]|nr:esterase family protein [Spirochaetota bacterium]